MCIIFIINCIVDKMDISSIITINIFNEDKPTRSLCQI